MGEGVLCLDPDTETHGDKRACRKEKKAKSGSHVFKVGTVL